MKRILLTGSTGLIGGTIYQRLSHSYEAVRLGRRAECEIQADLAKPESLAEIDLGGFAALVHCAGVTDEDFKSDSVAAYIQSTVGASVLVRQAVTCKVPKIAYFSSSHVYGPQVGRISEASPANPLSDYAIAHYATEQILRRHSSSATQVLTLRPNAVFGMPGNMNSFDRWSLIPYSFPLEAIYHRKIVLRSSGEQRRNFVGTEDLALFVERFLTARGSDRNDEDKVHYTIINPLGQETLSVYEFELKCAGLHKDLTGEPCQVERPETSGQEQSSAFEYQSLNEYHPATMNLNEYLLTFMRRILEDLENGRRYVA